ncbi:isocitrate lyase/PEP mutase family protein [Pseudalkalibacillus decolorationis]|uniref:isocitrate lyase/PEP mutase family protein n=1 Tax=Pseudalkalibacillus decolorationis TaxID=163879 RepID=UPI0021482A4D|nr:isocitrate lyase/phosphoenolpyruvate mutase family protein [Pseudalkalibacillus decolorationis]
MVAAGAAGINFEDQMVGSKTLYSIEDQCRRIKAVREVADQSSIPLFINARTDLFLKTDPRGHSEKHMKEALVRASAYAESGASGFFAPGLIDGNYIERLCNHSPLPVNILVKSGAPATRQLVKMGVARISYGPGPYRQMISTLKEQGREALLQKQI